MLTFSGISDEEERQMLTGLYEELHPLLCQMVSGITQSFQDAEDIVDSAWLSILKYARERLAGMSRNQQAAYIVTVCKHEAFRHIKKSRLRAELILDGESAQPGDSSPSVEELGELRELIAQAPAAFAALSPVQQELLHCRYTLGLSCKQIAHDLKLRESHVYVICAELCRKCAYDLSTHFDRLKPADYVCECCGSSTGVRQIDGLYINICELCKAKLTETF